MTDARNPTPEIVHHAVYDGLADWEVGHATAHIANGAWHRTPGRYRVATVGATEDPIVTMGGSTIVPDVVLAEVDPADSAMLILPGADAWAAGGLIEFRAAARTWIEDGVPVAAICGATAGLAIEGLLDDRAHTSNAKEFLVAMGYGGADRYVADRLAVTDDGVITASGIAPADFAREVFAALDLYEPEVLDAWFQLYGRHEAEGYERLMAAA